MSAAYWKLKDIVVSTRLVDEFVHWRIVHKSSIRDWPLIEFHTFLQNGIRELSCLDVSIWQPPRVR